MRYDAWDVILFPGDSHIPLQEFKTACYVSRDEYNRQLPTLTCYITSLPATNSFRISVHSWTAKARPSALIESRRKANQRVVYTVQVIIDGTRVFHDFYELSSKWPQELVYEKRSIADYDRHSSQRKPLLQFPAFHQSILMQSSWDARDHDGRINVILSEQLVSKSHNPSEVEFGATNDMICFSFQHAPKEILEQAGISWPIRNPLYLSPPNNNDLLASQPPPAYSRPLYPVVAARKQSPDSKQFQPPSSRASNFEPGARPRTEPPLRFSQFPKPPGGGKGHGRAGIWANSYDDTFIDPFDDVSMMDTGSARRTSSNLTADMLMPDLLHASPASSRSKNDWHHQNRSSGPDKHSTWAEPSGTKRRGEKHVVVALREDQFGQLVEAMSPPKRTLEREPDFHRYEQSRNQPLPPKPQGNPPKMGPMPVPSGNRPSAAALARGASYPEFHSHLRNVSSTASPSKPEAVYYKNPYKGSSNHPFDGGKENRNPSENRVPTPHPFLQGPVWGPSDHKPTPYGSDVDMRNPSSIYSNTFRFERGSQQPTGKHSPAPTPGSLKSRKEGLGIASPALAEQQGNRPDKSVRHDDKSLLLDLDTAHESPKMNAPAPPNSPKTIHTSPQTRLENILNAGEPKTFVQGHRSGMSSMGRVEAELFSALGEELNSFNEKFVETPDLPELSPLVKRKRAGTLGGERGKSPNSKMVREEIGSSDAGRCDDGRVELRLDGPKMRGGD